VTEMRSDAVKKGLERIPHRALFRACGLKTEDFDKPLVAIANSWNEAVPGHIKMMELYREIAEGVREAGGVPLGFGVPSICDGIAMNVEMRYSLPSRELVADSIESVVRSHSYDGWVGLTNCDKITPGMLMACGRLDIPAIIVTGGPMMAGVMGEERLDVISARRRPRESPSSGVPGRAPARGSSPPTPWPTSPRRWACH
jgi:dihydroxy-acid dehydratase